MDNTPPPTSPSLLPPIGRTEPSRRTTLRSLALLFAIAILATLPGYFPGRVYVPTDLLYQYAPWHDPANPDFRPGNPALLDQATQFVPWMIFAVDQLKQGEIPLWNPHQQLGAPFLANGQSAVFYPTILLHLLLPPAWSWTLAATLKLFLAGWGAYFLARHYRLSNPASLLAGIAFMLCGFNIVWLNHPHTNVMAWLPWAIGSLLRLLEKPSSLRMGVAAIILALQFLGGHPASCIHLVFTAGLVYFLHLFWLSPRQTLRATPAVFLALIIGFALAAVQWFPLLHYATHSGAAAARQHILDGQSWFQFHPKYLLGIVFPYANGYPADRITPYQISLATGLPNTNELVPAWAGTIPLLLAILAVVGNHRQRQIRLWVILALISAAVAIRVPLIDQLIRHTPGLALSQNARLLVVTALAIALLAGCGLDLLLARSMTVTSGFQPRRLRKLLLVASLALVFLSLSGTAAMVIVKDRIIARGRAAVARHYMDESKDSASDTHEYSQEYWDQVVRRIHSELVFTSLRLLIPAFIIMGVAWVLSARPHPVPWLTLATFDLLLFALPYNPGSSIATYYPAQASLSFLRSELTPDYRLAATHHALHPEAATAYDLRDIRGYDAVTSYCYYQWLRETGVVAAGMLPESIVLDDVNHPALRLLALRYLLAAADQPSPGPAWRLIYSSRHANIYENLSPLPRARIVPSAQWYTSPDAVLQRIAEMDFDPRQLVLLEGNGRPTVGDALTDRFFSREGAASPPQDTHPKIVYVEDSPRRVRLSISDTAAGWLVLADTYDPDWKVTLRRPGWAAQTGVVVPAYGILRAVFIPECRNGAIEVTFEYHPWSWRYGLDVTAAALVLLTGLLMYGLRWARLR